MITVSDTDINVSQTSWNVSGYVPGGGNPAQAASASQQLQVYDNLDGTMLLRWSAFYPGATSFNIYVNGVYVGFVTGQSALVTGLTKEAYNPATGVVTKSGTYNLKVVGAINGIEGAEVDQTVTVSPTSIMLVTPMRRPFPFPSTGGFS